MDVIIWEWLELGFRWLHVIAGIAWIGTSFYFMHLDASLKSSQNLPSEAGGETWQVHSGGFYHMVKFVVAPSQMPENLTWFKWEAYTTFLSGLVLLVIIYYLGAELYLIDNNVFELSTDIAITISASSIVISWFVYNSLCKSKLGQFEWALGIVGFALIAVSMWGFTQIFSARGAFMQMGAIIGSIMIINVWRIVIPNQKLVVEDLIAGRTPDPRLGAEAKLRSTHNNYLTLPVLFIMISNHYPLAYASEWNWVIFVIILIVGGIIRHYFNLKHGSEKNAWWCWVIAIIGITAAAWLSSISPTDSEKTVSAKVATTIVSLDQQVMEIVSTRCSMCHASKPLWEGLVAAPKGIVLDTQERVKAQAKQIYISSYLSNAMPPSNVSYMENSERKLIALWFASIESTKQASLK